MSDFDQNRWKHLGLDLLSCDEAIEVIKDYLVLLSDRDKEIERLKAELAKKNEPRFMLSEGRWMGSWDGSVIPKP